MDHDMDHSLTAAEAVTPGGQTAGSALTSPPQTLPSAVAATCVDVAAASEISRDPERDDTVAKILQAAHQDGNDENLNVLDQKVRALYYDLEVAHLVEKEKKSGDLYQRSKQALLHLAFTETRITELEKEMHSLNALIKGLPDTFEVNKNMRLPVYDHALKLSNTSEFRLTPQSFEIPDHLRPCLEVLVTEELLPPITTLSEAPRLDPNISFPPVARRRTQNLNMPITVRQVPEWLRIRSKALINHLETICHENFPLPMHGDDKKVSATVLLRPFKLLFYYADTIRGSLEDVQKLAERTRQSLVDGQPVMPKHGTIDELTFEHQDLAADLRLLIQFIDVNLQPTFALQQAIMDGSATEIAYADLWHVFQLGDIVVARDKKAMQAYRVINLAGGRDALIPLLEHYNDRVPSLAGFTVDCCSLFFNGTEYVPQLKTFTIRKYSGYRRITELDVYPLRFEAHAATIRADFLAQGRKYLEFTQRPFAHKMFEGHTLDEPPQALNAQVIVDVALAVSVEPNWLPETVVIEDDFSQQDMRETTLPPYCQHGRFQEGCCGSDIIFDDLNMNCEKMDPFRSNYGELLNPRPAKDLREEDLLLMPNWVYAFVLRVRQWVTVPMAGLSDVQFENNFDDLMFSPIHKQTMLALVETHENGHKSSGAGGDDSGSSKKKSVGTALDLVKGKGSGLIILLHGEPGVGKTLTAECVADKTQRPLFPITCGDIGETATEVERNLFHNFRLAHKWGCVLLLDEADVFLAKRNKTDLRRNAVTSVFLRSLEYYAGILFLTTNRVGGIDPAFKSRIHLSLYYPPLSLETTEKLFAVFLRRTELELQNSGDICFRIKKKEILCFARRHYRHLKRDGYNTWNGRQIRNAFQTAISLVEDEAAKQAPGLPKPTLGKAQFEIVADGTELFDRYLIHTLQGPDDEIAKRDQWRNDQWLSDIQTNTRASSSAVHVRPPIAAVPVLNVPDWRDTPKDSTEEDSDTEEDDEDYENDNKDEDDQDNNGNTKAGAPSRDTDDVEAQIREFFEFREMMKRKDKK